MAISNTVKGILTIIGGFFIHILNGSIYSWGNLNIYLISYLRIHSPDVVTDQGFFFLPMGIFASTLTLSLGGWLESKIGPRITLTIGCSIIVIGNMGLYFFDSLIMDYLSLFFYGLGIGINYIVPVRTAWHYFTKHKGKVVGIIICGFGVSACFLNFIGEAVINPDSLNPEKDGYYKKEVAERMPKYLLIISITFAVLAAIGISLVFPYEKENGLLAEESENDIQLNKIGTVKLLENESKNAQFISVNAIFDTKKKETVKNAILSKRFAATFIMALCSSTFLFIILNTFRQFAGTRQETSLLKFLAIGFSIANGFARPIWGILFDKIGFRRLFMTLSIFELLISTTFYFTVEITILFSTLVLLCGFLEAGVFSLMPAFVSKIFGLKLSSEVYGVCFLAYGISGFIGPVFIYLVNHAGIAKDNTTPYLIAYELGAVFSLTSIIVCYFTKEEPFLYD